MLGLGANGRSNGAKPKAALAKPKRVKAKA